MIKVIWIPGLSPLKPSGVSLQATHRQGVQGSAQVVSTTALKPFRQGTTTLHGMLHVPLTFGNHNCAGRQKPRQSPALSRAEEAEGVDKRGGTRGSKWKSAGPKTLLVEKSGSLQQAQFQHQGIAANDVFLYIYKCTHDSHPLHSSDFVRAAECWDDSSNPRINPLP